MSIVSLIKDKLKGIVLPILATLNWVLNGMPEKKYYCPVCKKKVFQWRQFRRGIGHGKSMLEAGGRRCPLCNSFERTRQFTLYLEQKKILADKPRMLHFAPERGLQPGLRKKLRKNYITADLFMPGVDRKEDMTAMTFEDNSFDFIYCSNVLEHIEDDAAAMSELYRVLAPGGWAIIQVPTKGKVTYEDPTITDPHERWKHFGQEDHVRYYGEDIEERLSKAGFEITPFYMLDVLDLNEVDIERMNLNKRELIHKCVKPAN